MDGFDIRSPRFARYILSNAALETLAAGFRWIEGPVWMGDANCLQMDKRAIARVV